MKKTQCKLIIESSDPNNPNGKITRTTIEKNTTIDLTTGYITSPFWSGQEGGVGVHFNYQGLDYRFYVELLPGGLIRVKNAMQASPFKELSFKEKLDNSLPEHNSQQKKFKI